MTATETMSRLCARGFKYGIVGCGTFLFDFLLLSGFISLLNFPHFPAIVLSFFASASVGFYIAYNWIYKGTKQTRARGYTYFLFITLLVGITTAYIVTLFVETQGTNFYITWALITTLMGILSFLTNTFFNFRVL